MRYQVLLVAISLLTSMNANSSEPAVSVVSVLPETAFIVNGFDNNDRTQIILDGSYSSDCFKVAETRVKIDKQNKKIQVRDEAYFYEGLLCTGMLVPYTKTVNLGLLPVGDYQVTAFDSSNNSKSLGVLKVAEAKSEKPDDYMYAPIREVSIDESISPARVTLKGVFTKSCLNLKEVLVTVGENFVVLQPIAEVIPGANCEDAPKRFEKEVTLNGAPKGRVLVHVRSLNGQSINHVVDL